MPIDGRMLNDARRALNSSGTDHCALIVSLFVTMVFHFHRISSLLKMTRHIRPDAKPEGLLRVNPMGVVLYPELLTSTGRRARKAFVHSLVVFLACAVVGGVLYFVSNPSVS